MAYREVAPFETCLSIRALDELDPYSRRTDSLAGGALIYAASRAALRPLSLAS